MHSASCKGSGSHPAALVLGEGTQGLLPCKGIGGMKGGTEASELQHGLVPSPRFYSSLWLTQEHLSSCSSGNSVTFLERLAARHHVYRFVKCLCHPTTIRTGTHCCSHFTDEKTGV